MKKNLMFFALGVSTTFLMGAGISHWNQVNQENKYGAMVGRFYGCALDSEGRSMEVNVPLENRHALIWNGEIGDDAKKAMVVGFIHGMAVGRKKQKGSTSSNRGWGY